MQRVFARFLSVQLLAAAAAFGQGSLTPPGAPAPGMKSLQELWDKLTSLSQAQKFAAFTNANATTAGGMKSSPIPIAAGRLVKLESIAVTTYQDPVATAYVRFLVKEGPSVSRIMVMRVPTTATGSDPLPDTRSGVLNLNMWVSGGNVFDVAVGDVHSLEVRVQSSSTNETASSSWVLTGYFANP